ncbi:MAG: hypothetical protein ACREFY_20225 [Acetobacteraceae bacterium]
MSPLRIDDPASSRPGIDGPPGRRAPFICVRLRIEHLGRRERRLVPEPWSSWFQAYGLVDV